MNQLVELTWKNISVRTKDTNELLLSNVSGQLKPCTMTAIMGTSGSGKSTLLNTLTGRCDDNLEIKGKILVNGWERDMKTWGGVSAYVTQKFKYYDKQTVQETLEFVCNVHGFSKKKTSELISALLKLLGINYARNSLVRNISGGERVRLSIGIELIGDRRIIFLDEPTSGLDSFNSINCIEFFKELALGGKTVVVVIHQPSYHALQYFDNIILISRGKKIYEGSCDDCISFFNRQNFPLPEKTNPSDFFLELISIDYRSNEKEEFCLERISGFSKAWAREETEHVISCTERIVHTPISHSGWKFIYIFLRAIKNRLRDSQYIKGFACKRLVLVGVVYLMFCQIGKDTNLNIMSLISFSIIAFNNIYLGMFYSCLNTFMNDKQIISRERQCGMYSGVSIFMGKALAELVFGGLFELPFLSIAYFVFGFKNSLRKFSCYIFINIINLFFASMIGSLISVSCESLYASLVWGGCFNTVINALTKVVGATPSESFLYNFLLNYSPVQLVYRSFYKMFYDDYNLIITNNESNKDNSCSEALREKLLNLDGASASFSLLCLFAYGVVFSILGSFILHYKTITKLKLNSK